MLGGRQMSGNFGEGRIQEIEKGQEGGADPQARLASQPHE